MNTYHGELRQKYVLEAIREHIRITGKSPSNRHLSLRLGLGIPTISKYISQIENRGWLIVERGENWRVITITNEAPIFHKGAMS